MQTINAHRMNDFGICKRLRLLSYGQAPVPCKRAARKGWSCRAQAVPPPSANGNRVVAGRQQQELTLQPVHAAASQAVLPDRTSKQPATTQDEAKLVMEPAMIASPMSRARRMRTKERVHMAKTLGLDLPEANLHSSSSSSSRKDGSKLRRQLGVLDSVGSLASVDEQKLPAFWQQQSAAAATGLAGNKITNNALLAGHIQDVQVAAEDLESSAKHGAEQSATSGVGDEQRHAQLEATAASATEPLLDAVEAAAADPVAAAITAGFTIGAAAKSLMSYDGPDLYAEFDIAEAIVRMDVARSPDEQPLQQFYMPDPLCVPCKCIDAGIEKQHFDYDDKMVTALWAEAQKTARHAGDPEKDLWWETDAEESPAGTQGESSAESVGPSSTSTSNSSEAEAALGSNVTGASQQPAALAQAAVEFRYHRVTQPGERVWLVGDDEELGAWDLDDAVKLKWNDGHFWTATLSFDKGSKIAYKAVLQLTNKERKDWKWESGSNHELVVVDNTVTVKHEFV